MGWSEQLAGVSSGLERAVGWSEQGCEGAVGESALGMSYQGAEREGEVRRLGLEVCQEKTRAPQIDVGNKGSRRDSDISNSSSTDAEEEE